MAILAFLALLAHAARRYLARLPAIAAVAACTLGAVAVAAPPGTALAEFTRRVQPLVLNRCASGACHGGAKAAAPRLDRGDVAGRIDRATTLANVDAVLAACGPSRDPAALIATISGRHPASANSPHQLATPLTPAERATLEGWLRTALTAQTFARAPVAGPTTPNRLQKLLDTAANPPALPPPEESKGIRLE